MRKANYIIVVACASLLLNACNTFEFEDKESNPKLDYLVLSNVKTDFDVGEIYQNSLSFDLMAYYQDGTFKEVKSDYQFGISKFYSIDGYTCSFDTPVEVAGEYAASFMVSYSENGITKSIGGSTMNTFNSLIGKEGQNCTDFKAKMRNVLKPGDLLKEHLDIELEFTWNETVKEIFYLKEERGDITMSLLPEGSTVESIDQPLVRLQNYSLYLGYKTLTARIDFAPALGVVRVNRDELTILPTDFNTAYSPRTSVKTLIIPITLTTDNSTIATRMGTWDSTTLANLANAYSSDDPLSFKSYYAGLGINMDIVVAEPFVETTYKVEQITTQFKPWTRLYELINRAFAHTKEAFTPAELAQFDSNNDGQIDNVHIIPNYDETQWGTAFWPHQGQTFNMSGTPENMVANTYCVGSFSKASTLGEVTQIHEQGHVFGLLDYYDYTNNSASPVNYIGHADMQSDNIFDWNSYSKLSVGLADAYVVTGNENSVEITIGDSATTNECIIIPADYSTWNGSAYDEYFLVELFSKKGINEQFWDSYGYLDGVDCGIRIYHVDSRLYDQFKDHEASPNKEDWSSFTIVGANNCSDYTALGIGSPKEWGDFKQLCLIQKGGVDTFGSTDGSVRHYLNEEDLFVADDIFTFNNYKHFLSKSGESVSSMDNGETFNWNIRIKTLTIDSSTIEVYR